MDNFLILFRQLLIMCIFMAVGWCMYKGKLVAAQDSKAFGNLLLYIVMPCAIIKSYCVERTPEKLQGLLFSAVAALLALLLAMAVSSVLFRGKKIERFGIAFSNAGFMGIPIVTAVLGSEAVFYISSFVALLNILQWTYGVAVMTDSLDCIKGKKLAKNPILISMLIGLILFFTQLSLPGVVSSAVSSMAALNAPLAMVVLGIYLAQTDLIRIFNQGYLYYVSAVRLVVIPLLTVVLLKLFPMDSTIRLAILIAAAAPIGSNVAIFAQLHNQDYKLAVREVCLSTILSVLTMPVLVAIAMPFL